MTHRRRRRRHHRLVACRLLGDIATAPPPVGICGDEGFVVRHKRWGGTEENFPTGGMFVHPEYPPDPDLPANSIEGPALAFRDGAGTELSAFDLLALVAEPIADAHPPVPPSCDVKEAILNGAAATACTLNSECQGNRTCGSGSCSGFAGAACCAHVSPGACLATDGYCRETTAPNPLAPFYMPLGTLVTPRVLWLCASIIILC